MATPRDGGKAFRHCALMCAVVLVMPGVARTQTTVNMVSLNAGIIRIFDRFGGTTEGAPYVMYPEVQLGGDLFTPGIRWVAFWGYSDDRQAQAQYSPSAYSLHAVGIRLALLPADLLPHWLVPIGVFVGAGYHAATFRYINGWITFRETSQLPRTPRDLSVGMFALEAGLNLEVRVYGPLALRGEVRQIIPLEGGYPDSMMLFRRSVTAGIACRF